MSTAPGGGARFIDAGRLTVRQIDLATLRVPVKRLNKVFAFNVNLFWVRECEDEVALLHERVLPGGSVYLFYDASRPEQVPTMVRRPRRRCSRRASGSRSWSRRRPRWSGSSASGEGFSLNCLDIRLFPDVVSLQDRT